MDPSHGDGDGWGWGPAFTDEQKDAAAERTARRLTERGTFRPAARRDPSTYVDLDIVADRQRRDALHASALADLDRRVELAARTRALDAPTIPIPRPPATALTGTPDTRAQEPDTADMAVSDMNRQQLREECRRRGISQQGTTADLRMRLAGTAADTRAGTPDTHMPG